MRPEPQLSVVVLTLDEEANVADCLASLACQEDLRFEVVLVDAASADRTVAIARSMVPLFPVPLRIEACDTRLPIGAARNLGVALARAHNVAFLSADAEADPSWTRRALEGLQEADMLFGRQVHAPRSWGLGATVRGLRYDFPEDAAKADPLRLASNVAAAYRKEVLLAYPFDDWTNAAEDLLLARRASRSGRRAAYDPRLVVRHHDVAGARAEWRKNVREGLGWGVYRAELGYLPALLAWGAALGLCAAALALRPGPLPLAALAAVLWAPAVRRALRRRPDRAPAGPRLLATLASPAFDLAFLASYLRGLATRRAAPARIAATATAPTPLPETRP